LKNRPESVVNLQRLELQLKQAGSEADGFSSRLGLLKDEDLQSYQQLAALKGEVRSETEAVKRVSESLAEAIRDVEFRRRNWLAEKNRWDRWSFPTADRPGVKQCGRCLHPGPRRTLAKRWRFFPGQLEPMLAVQQQAGDIGAKFGGLTDQIDTMMAQQRGETLRGGMPPMFSVAYLQAADRTGPMNPPG
jgi:hypothetical protein